MATPCPKLRQLRVLLDRNPTAGDQPHLAEHIEHCPHCQQRLETLAGGVDWLPGATRGWETPTPAVQRAMDQLRSTGRNRPSQDHQLSDEDRLYFLTPTDRPGFIGCFGPYDVIELVGHGGMGIVLKVRDPSLHRVVAIKVLSPALATNPTARRRFIREARAAAAVSHDHVVTIHAVDEIDGLPFLMMQCIPGRSLQQRIDTTGPLKVEEILRIGMQSASGLAAAHAIGLVHRDVKPANILLENGIERAIITDFGLARAAHDVMITQSGLISGTPQYMSPEQIRDEPIDHRSDLFSLGGVLYAMCTGSPPFTGSTLLSVMRRVCEEAPAAIGDINEAIPVWLTEIVDRLLAKEPAKRYQSAADVAEVLGNRLAEMHRLASSAADQKRTQSTEQAMSGARSTSPDRSGKQGTPEAGPTSLPAFPVTAPAKRKPWFQLKVGRLLITVGAVASLAVVALLTISLATNESIHPTPPPADSNSQGPVSAPPKFAILAGRDAKEEGFDTLAEAVDAALAGDTIEVRYDGIRQTEPLRLIRRNRSKPLEIRAAEGCQPTIEVRSRDAPMFATTSALVLEGLGLRRAAHGPGPRRNSRQKPLIACAQAVLYIANCRFYERSAPGGQSNGVIVHVDGARSCELRNCELYSQRATAIRWRHQDFIPSASGLIANLHVRNCVHAGGDFLRLEYESRHPALLRLEGNTLIGATLIRQKYEINIQKTETRLTVEASNNVFTFPATLKMLHQDSLQQWFHWYGRQNLFCTQRALLMGFPTGEMRLDHGEAIVGRSLDDWSQFWNNTDSDSRLARVVYAGGSPSGQGAFSSFLDRRRRPVDDRCLLTPDDFRIITVESDDGKALTAEERDTFGANVSLVGPGKPYEDWKQTPEYQEWRRRVDRAMNAAR